MAKRKRKSKTGCLLGIIFLLIDELIKPIMLWGGFATSTRKKRRKKR